MKFHVKLSTENLPSKFHGFPWIMFYGNSMWSLHGVFIFLPTWKYYGKFFMESFHGIPMFHVV